MRRETRQSLSRPGRIELGDGKILSCRIADLSSGGALLELPDSEWLPQVFKLVDVFNNATREVRAMWRTPDKVGVKFLDAPVATTKKPAGFGKRR